MKKLFPILLAVAFSGSFAILFAIRFGSHTPSEAEDYAHLPRSDSPPALFNSPEFSFRDQHGQTVSKASLAGQPYVANFIFTTCRTICPLLTSKMVRLQRDLPGVPLRFVSFSVDPEHDTVDALKTYAEHWNPDEQRWLLLETTPKGLEEAAAGFRVTAQRTDGGLDAVMHSAVFLLVDAYGVVRGVYSSEEPGEFKALVRDARTLVGAGAGPVPVAQARSGEVLFHELSCVNCHERPELAPPLGGLLGQRRELVTRLLVTADEAYLKESIVAPVAKRVAGYPLMMPSYADHLTLEELDSLVKYIVALPPPASTPDDVLVEVDPVCHMKVRVTQNAFSVRLDGGPPVYFCSAWCKARFSENPDAYRR